jgi:hypothetical protein
MKKLRFLRALSVFGLATCLFGVTVGPINLGTLSSATNTAVVPLNGIISYHTVQIATAGSPSGCTLHLEGTLDNPPASGSTWADLSGDITCTSSVTFHVVNRAVSGIRVAVTALTGGTQPNVTIKYAGVQ